MKIEKVWVNGKLWEPTVVLLDKGQARVVLPPSLPRGKPCVLEVLYLEEPGKV